jgi:hypothetical protein
VWNLLLAKRRERQCQQPVGAGCLAVRSSPLLLRWGEFAARRTLYDSLSKHNLAARPVCKTALLGADYQFDDIPLALFAEKRRRGLAPTCGCNDDLSYYVL